MSLLDVVAVQVTDEYQLLLTFENQEQHLFDMRPFIAPPVEQIEKWGRFQKGTYSTGYYCLAWTDRYRP